MKIILQIRVRYSTTEANKTSVCEFNKIGGNIWKELVEW